MGVDIVAQEPGPKRLSLGRTLWRGGLIGVTVAIVLELLHVLLGPNFHVVVPGAIYRASQPTAERLHALVPRYGIRTIINMRGTSDPSPWYVEECRAVHDLSICQEDMCCSATRLPPIPTIRRLVEVLDHCEYPILIHCFRGIDRTGMAVATALLLHTDLDPEKARRHLSLRHGHLSVGRTGAIDRFFDLYEEWLESKGLSHSRANFRQWAMWEYCPGECRFQLTLVDAESLSRLPVGKPIGIPVRVTNTSVKPWYFRPGTNAGIHCQFGLSGEGIDFRGKAGLFNATVQPGETIELALALPAMRRPGKYELHVDMNDPQHAGFESMGHEPLRFAMEAK